VQFFKKLAISSIFNFLDNPIKLGLNLSDKAIIFSLINFKLGFKLLNLIAKIVNFFCQNIFLLLLKFRHFFYL